MGSGQKPKTQRERALAGSRERTAARDSGHGDPALLVPPADLPEAAQVWWRRLAPHAVVTTLAPSTALAFADLCMLRVRLDEIVAAIARDGVMVDGQQHPLLSQERQYRARVEIGMRAFMLAPFGKAVEADEAPVDPFAEFDPAPLTVVQGGRG